MKNLSWSQNSRRCLKYFGALSLGYILIPSEVYALASVDFAIQEICSHMEGSLGGLLMATAGVGGIISAAFGNMKAMYSCIVTAIGAFTISSMLSLHFPDAANKCSNAGGASGFNGFQGDVNPGGGAGLATARTKLYDGSSSTTPAEVSRFNVEKSVKSYLEKSSSHNGTDSGADSSLESYVDSPQDDSDMELF